MSVDNPNANPWDPYVTQLTKKAQMAGVTPEDYASDFAHHADGSNLDAIFNDLSASIDRRAQPTNSRIVDSQSPEGNALYGSGTGNNGTGSGFAGSPRDGGASASSGQLTQLLDAIRGINAQPDVDLSGLTPGEIPNFEVPGENLGPDIDNTLMDLMEGRGDNLGLEDRLRALLDQTQGGGVNSNRLFQRQQLARENLTRGEEAAMSDLRGSLADRGLIGLPGSPEGSELEGMTRTFQPLQREYLSQLRQSNIEESQAADDAQLNALTAATGWTQDQAATKLAAARSGTERQQMLSTIALDTLGKNMEWNKFLAEFGLNREQVQAQIQQGKIDAIAPLLSMFQLLIQQSRGGFV